MTPLSVPKLSDERKHYTIALFFSFAVLVPILWLAMDREKPHARTSGTIETASPKHCNQSDELPQGAIYPGSCVKVSWALKQLRTCPPSSEFSVQRQITDSQGRRWTIGPVVGAPLHTLNPRMGNLSRYFTLPANIPYGSAIYYASACFACNPLQHFWPVCVDEPKIPFEILKPEGDIK